MYTPSTHVPVCSNMLFLIRKHLTLWFPAFVPHFGTGWFHLGGRHLFPKMGELTCVPQNGVQILQVLLRCSRHFRCYNLHMRSLTLGLDPLRGLKQGRRRRAAAKAAQEKPETVQYG